MINTSVTVKNINNDSTRIELSSSDDSNIWITLSKTGFAELDVKVDANDLKHAIRKLTVK